MEATDSQHATAEELFREVFSMWSVPSLYNEQQLQII
jgi:hypothetical protein